MAAIFNLLSAVLCTISAGATGIALILSFSATPNIIDGVAIVGSSLGFIGGVAWIVAAFYGLNEIESADDRVKAHILSAIVCVMTTSATGIVILFSFPLLPLSIWTVATIAAFIATLAGAGWLLRAVASPGVHLPIFLAAPYVFALFAAMIWSIIVAYASLFVFLGVDDGGTKGVHDPMKSLYLSMITWGTVGYGDVVPSESARLWAASEGIVGYIMMVGFIAAVTSIFKK